MRRPLVNIFSVLALLAVAACMENGAKQAGGQAGFSTTPPPPEQGVSTPAQEQPSAAAPSYALPGNVPTVRIALLLPMSGDSQVLGQSLLDAATLALHDIYMPLKADQIRARIILIPKDTGVSPASAAKAAEEALAQGAQLIIGPLYGAASAAAAPVARKSGVPMLSLSNNKALAGDNVYVFGFLPGQQITRVAEYAARVNVSSFGALLPNDDYGTTVSDTLKNALTGRGILVDPVEMYAGTQANLDAAALRLKQGYEKTHFQALFIAEGGDQLKNILASLKAQGFTRNTVRWIGTGLWDDEDTIKNPDMQGAWFASSPPQFYAAFERHFMAAYGYKPQRLASLTYDAVTLAAQLSMQAGAANFSRAALTQPDGFKGPANGLYRLMPGGTNERALCVMEIGGGGGVKILENAPLGFEPAEPAHPAAAMPAATPSAPR